MKLRLHGNALRLRLSRSEVDRFRDTGRIEEAMQFSGSAALSWTLESSPATEVPQVSYKDGGILVQVPAAQATGWAGSSQVGIYSAAGSATPAISIEKDFQCLHDAPTASAENDDAFPNPAA